MIGIVVVSHSALLAQGVLDLLGQMTQGAVPLAAAGGTTIVEAPLGTDPVVVLEAYETLFQDAGVDDVVVFMDLGSALMSAETAREFLSDELRSRVHLSPAPLVEGALAGAVCARIGGSVAEVLAEAESASVNKSSQLGDVDGSGFGDLPEFHDSHPALFESAVTPVERFDIQVPNRLGLHARPATRIVQLVAEHGISMQISHRGKQADARSLNQILTLGARGGDTVTVSIGGSAAAAARQALETLAAEHFGDPPDPGTPSSSAAQGAAVAPVSSDTVLGSPIRGVTVFPGLAIAPPWLLHRRKLLPPRRTVVDPESECMRLEQVLAQASADLHSLAAMTTRRLGAAEAAVFTAQSLMISDPALLQDARALIRTEALDAASAWHQVQSVMLERYQAMDDDFFRQRANDLEDAGDRVLLGLMGESAGILPDGPAVDSILVAAELTPSDVAQIDIQRIRGIVVGAGGASSHAAILARSLGIPTLIGVGGCWQKLGQASELALDAAAGIVEADPDAEARIRWQELERHWRTRQVAERVAAAAPAHLRSGEPVPIYANIGHPDEIAGALRDGAEGVGLFRSELLFMNREAPPSEAEQYACYRQAAIALGGRPLVVRTLDVGGDKPLPYAAMGLETNPFLGVRGLRYCLANPDLFFPQLRALLRLAGEFPLRLMFPMVSTQEELDILEAQIKDLSEELRAEGFLVPDSISWGIMIETPAAVWSARDWARRVGFFSIGTNDLSQYVMAADRGNERVAELSRRLQPALVRAIAAVVDGGHAAGIPVTVCGEWAADPEVAAILIGLGVDGLSMASPAIPAVKAGIRRLAAEEARGLADAAVAAPSAKALSELVGRFLLEAADRADDAGAPVGS
jgi:phosphoenolpyruvate-protein phosphotransferase/dihydroxyacetone kinase phosphotransfer subunit